jgi:hypothetical protein
MTTSLKTVLSSDSWIVTKIIQGRDSYRVDAKRRFPIADEKNTFSAWGSKEYVERLTRDNYGKKPSEFNCFQY